MELSKELKEKAKACKTVEELVALAKANDIELNAEDAEFLLKDFAEKELADNELENVAGGTDGCIKPGNPYPMEYWKTREAVQYLFGAGTTVESFGDWGVHHTATCRVMDRRPEFSSQYLGFYDVYELEQVEGSRTPFTNGWKSRDQIERR